MTVLRIIPLEGGKAHEVRRGEQALGYVVKRLPVGEFKWGLLGLDGRFITSTLWRSRSGAAVALATHCDAPGAPL